MVHYSQILSYQSSLSLFYPNNVARTTRNNAIIVCDLQAFFKRS